MVFLSLSGVLVFDGKSINYMYKKTNFAYDL